MDSDVHLQLKQARQELRGLESQFQYVSRKVNCPSKFSGF